MIHLIIPDSHVKPGISNERFKRLSRLILDLKPDVIVNLGDFADMPSLSSYDKGTKGYEGRRYIKDINAAIEANDILFSEINKYNKIKKRAKKKGYYPKTVFCYGNHEYRIERAVNSDAILEGVIGLDDLNYSEYYDILIPYLSSITIDGISYSHCYQYDNSPAIIGGVHQAHTLLSQKHNSVTVGHSHKLDFKVHTSVQGNKLMGLVAGCFFQHQEDYAHMSNKSWWRGVVIKHNVHNGYYDPEFLSIKRLEKLYG